MRYRALGDSGLQVSEIGLGSHLTFGTRLDLANSRRCVARAIELGINLFDTADGYGDGEAERSLGRVLADHRREGWVVATKCFFPRSEARTDRGLSRKHVVESVHRSLRRLRVDHIDLMQCHRFDDATPLRETLETMDDLVRQGKILYWGLGNFSADQIEEATRLAASLGLRMPVAHQVRYSLFDRAIEPTVLSTARQCGLGTLAYGALGQGVLTGKYSAAEPPRGSRAADDELRDTMYDLRPGKVAVAARLAAVARSRDWAPGRLALAWCLRDEAISSVLVGASGPEQIEQNAVASGTKLDEGLRREIEAACEAGDPVD